jgi:hypothetical protein
VRKYAATATRAVAAGPAGPGGRDEQQRDDEQREVEHLAAWLLSGVVARYRVNGIETASAYPSRPPFGVVPANRPTTNAASGFMTYWTTAAAITRPTPATTARASCTNFCSPAAHPPSPIPRTTNSRVKFSTLDTPFSGYPLARYRTPSISWSANRASSTTDGRVRPPADGLTAPTSISSIRAATSSCDAHASWANGVDRGSA